MSEKKFKYSPDHTFFTSDTHFGHANIIRFCKRPFENVEEMNEALIENWNKVVSDDDTVFHLGEYTIDGHDYIKKGYGMAHSGTCKKCKQERDSIVNVLIKELSAN